METSSSGIFSLWHETSFPGNASLHILHIGAHSQSSVQLPPWGLERSKCHLGVAEVSPRCHPWVCRRGQSHSSHPVPTVTHTVSSWTQQWEMLLKLLCQSHSFQPLIRGRKVFSNEISSPMLTFKVNSPFPQAEVLVSAFVDRHQIAFS